MAAKSIRTRAEPISQVAILASPDDLDGVQDNTKSFDVTGAARCIITVINNGTAGTAGIDVVAKSHDGGANWAPVPDLVPAANDDFTGDVAAGAVLMAAGVEPTTSGHLFRCGPYDGPTALRIYRKTGDITGAVTWVTGAPGVYLQTVGQTSGALTALA